MALTEERKRAALLTMSVEEYAEIPKSGRGGKTYCPVTEFLLKLKPWQSTLLSREFFDKKAVNSRVNSIRLRSDTSKLSYFVREEDNGFRVYCAAKNKN